MPDGETVTAVVTLGPNMARTSWLIVTFGEIEQSRGISWYYKGLCPLNSRH
jgi:hypothetical protein